MSAGNIFSFWITSSNSTIHGPHWKWFHWIVRKMCIIIHRFMAQFDLLFITKYDVMEMSEAHSFWYQRTNFVRVKGKCQTHCRCWTRMINVFVGGVNDLLTQYQAYVGWFWVVQNSVFIAPARTTWTKLGAAVLTEPNVRESGKNCAFYLRPHDSKRKDFVFTHNKKMANEKETTEYLTIAPLRKLANNGTYWFNMRVNNGTERRKIYEDS